MVGLGCVVGVRPSWRWQWQHHPILASKSDEEAAAVTVTLTPTRSWPFIPSSSSSSCTNRNHGCFTITNGRSSPWRRFSVPDNRDVEEEEGAASAASESEQQVELEIEWKLFTRRIRNSGIISSCLVGLLTGVAVVLFNNVVS